jgi:hypothetical protein
VLSFPECADITKHENRINSGQATIRIGPGKCEEMLDAKRALRTSSELIL